ncbi:nuclear transport factor 2 family protein [Maribellus luteus]|uniref:Nuclear transport factor 2 family protein n=1 Tax=Maribellus luteus TaxID=2305463 RepID=A0A399SWC5_9BACT|nr:nuclear transport factor 2 family protein [Maribellus luteus]RIJ48370.1 nuclear transport factor 2 family protein [Maribellus luteus]
MRRLFFIAGIALFVLGCTAPDPEQEKAKVETAIQEFYAAAQKFDFEAIPTFCTTDFTAFEDGMFFNNINDFMDVFKSLEGATIDMKLNFVKTEVSGNMATSVVEFDAHFIKDPAKIHFTTYENYVLKKEDGKWLLHYFHSSHLPNPEDTDFATVHLLKIPEDLSIEKLQENIEKLNAAISSLGYWNCGYTLFNVEENSNDTYNYFIKGNWNNAESYKIIHDSEAFKSVAGTMPEVVKDYFKDQVYAKVEKMK